MYLNVCGQNDLYIAGKLGDPEILEIGMCTHKMYRIYKLIWLQVYIGGHGGLLCPSPQLHSEVLHGALKNYFVPSTPKCLFASVGQGETQALIFIRNQLFTNEFFQQNIEHLLHTRYNVR